MYIYDYSQYVTVTLPISVSGQQTATQTADTTTAQFVNVQGPAKKKKKSTLDDQSRRTAAQEIDAVRKKSPALSPTTTFCETCGAIQPPVTTSREKRKTDEFSNDLIAKSQNQEGGDRTADART